MSEKAPNCTKGTPTPTPKGSTTTGTPTPTPKNGQTPTPTNTSKKGATPEGEVNAKYINDTTIQVTWPDDKTKTRAKKYIIKLTETTGENPMTITMESSTSPAKITLKENQKGKKYYAQVSSVGEDGIPSQFTAKKSDSDRIASPPTSVSSLPKCGTDAAKGKSGGSGQAMTQIPIKCSLNGKEVFCSACP